MTLCPVAIAVGCRKCPVFRVCPAKGVIGDFKHDQTDRSQGKKKKSSASKAKK